MSDEVLDWKGNEVKEGMTIYFVQMKTPHWGRGQMLFPGRGLVFTESEEDFQERKKDCENLWILGDELLVYKDENNRLFVTTVTKGIGEFEGCTFTCHVGLLTQKKFSPDLTIAIKGISDKSEGN